MRVIDSHTEGEPTRVVVEGLPDLGAGTAAERAARFRESFDWFRSAIVNEPRGHDAVVGALLLPPSSPEAVAQTIYFNNVGTLHMCVHGTIGLARTLVHLGRIGTGAHTLETPVGDVVMHVHDDDSVSVDNVTSFRSAADVTIETSTHGTVVGDVAWGGNWFFLTEDGGVPVRMSNLEALTACASDIRDALERHGVTGTAGDEIDHIEIFGPPERDDADSKNFVLCPGKAYDRSPCGTGTSAKMACLAAAGRLAEDHPWRQESIVGSLFVGSISPAPDGPEGAVRPRVRGSAFVTADARLLLDPRDPFRHGIS